jgi:hypothetical protein
LCCEPANRSAIGLSSLLMKPAVEVAGIYRAPARPESKKFFFGEAAIFKELVRFTTKSLYTE